jgi:hypothetical protein
MHIQRDQTACQIRQMKSRERFVSSCSTRFYSRPLGSPTISFQNANARRGAKPCVLAGPAVWSDPWIQSGRRIAIEWKAGTVRINGPDSVPFFSCLPFIISEKMTRCSGSTRSSYSLTVLDFLFTCEPVGSAQVLVTPRIKVCPIACS